jgi:hypothetical protein
MARATKSPETGTVPERPGCGEYVHMIRITIQP